METFDKPRRWKSFLRGILYVLSAILLLVSVCVNVMVHNVLDARRCKNIICDEKFDQVVKQAVINSISASSSVIELDVQKLTEDAIVDAMVAYAREYTEDFIDSAFSNKEFSPKPFDNALFKNSVLEQLNTYSDELTEEEIAEICNEATSNIEDTLQYIPNILLQSVKGFLPILNKITVLVKFEIPLYLLTAISITVAFLFGGKNHRFDVWFGLSASMFISFVTIFIPLFMACFYDVPSKLAIGKSLLLCFVEGLNRVLIVNPTIFIGVVFALITVSLITSIVLISKIKAKQEKIYQKTVDKTKQ